MMSRNVVVCLIPSDSVNTLPDIELNIEDSKDSEYYVTHFELFKMLKFFGNTMVHHSF